MTMVVKKGTWMLRKRRYLSRDRWEGARFVLLSRQSFFCDSLRWICDSVAAADSFQHSLPCERRQLTPSQVSLLTVENNISMLLYESTTALGLLAIQFEVIVVHVPTFQNLEIEPKIKRAKRKKSGRNEKWKSSRKQIL